MPYIGTVVWLNDEDGIVCGQGCITGFSTLHNRQVPSSHASVVVTSLVAGKQVAPPCPSPFDGDVVQLGEFHIWPLSRVCALN